MLIQRSGLFWAHYQDSHNIPPQLPMQAALPLKQSDESKETQNKVNSFLLHGYVPAAVLKKWEIQQTSVGGPIYNYTNCHALLHIDLKQLLMFLYKILISIYVFYYNVNVRTARCFTVIFSPLQTIK